MTRGMTQTNWDAVIASSPLNRDAAVVASGKGSGFIPANAGAELHHVHSEIPLPLKQITRKMRESEGWRDLTGLRVGRLTVIGLGEAAHERKRVAPWVVRCVCGRYEHRTAKFLKAGNASHGAAQCTECDYTQRLRAGISPVSFPKIDVRAK